jgi:cobalt/nickel transport system permease protein
MIFVVFSFGERRKGSMHISEGVLSAPVLISGAVIAAGGVGIGVKKLDYDRIPQVAVLSSAFFVASLVHVPIGPSSVHLILNGLLGLLLGWTAFPAIVIALFLQAVLFQFGGLTTLGVNTVTMALPAVLCYLVFRKGVMSERPKVSMVFSFSCGAGAVLVAGILVALALMSTGKPFSAAAELIVVAHIPVMAIEGIITMLCVRFLKKVKPEVLEVTHG